MPKKEKRTVIMAEDPYKVTPPSLKSRASKAISAVRGSIRGKGVGGTIGTMKRQSAPKVKLQWRAGLLKSSAKNRGRGKVRGKAKAGFRFKIKF